MKFNNKVAIITGAGSGIGRTTSLLFSKEGAKVVVADIDEPKGLNTVEAIKAAGGEALFVKTDVSIAADVRTMVGRVVEAYKRIDILANVAGVFMEGDVVSTSEEAWARVMAINLYGICNCMKYCIPEMIKAGRGTIVNIASEAGLVGIRNQVAYNVSKSAVIALTNSCALDFVDRNITVNCLCPGRVLTPLVENYVRESADPEQTRRRLSEDRPIKRMGSPEEIAAGILFLASDEARYAMGTALIMDGGYTIQ